MGGIKLTLDLAIGETSAIESTDKGKINDIVQKVKDLNGRLQDIRREQVFQRVSFDNSFGWKGIKRPLMLGSISEDVRRYLLMLHDRNVKPSSEINPSQQTQESSDGH